MNTTIKHLDEFEKELTITIDWNEIEEVYLDILKRYAKIPVKGFRPGKIPAGITESVFRNEIKNDLVAACSTRFCRKALKENNLEAGSPIEVREAELKKKETLLLKAWFIEMPKFDLPDYAHLNIESTDEEDILNEISEKLLKQTDFEIHQTLIENELIYSETEDEDEDILEEDLAAAEDRAKLILILKKIATQDNIEVNEKDVDDRIKIIAEENDMHAEDIKNFFLMHGGIGRLSDTLLAEQVLAYIKEINMNIFDKQ